MTVKKQKGINLLSEVALTEEDQYEEVPKKSLRDLHKTHPSGSGIVTKITPSAAKIKPSVTNEGTGVKLGVLDVTEEELTESEVESWGRDEDDSNNEHDSRSDQERDSGDDNTKSDSEKEEIEDDEEENEDEFVKTPSNDTDDEAETKIKDKTKEDEDAGMDYTTNHFDDDVNVRLNEPATTDEGFIQKEGTDAEMTNIQQGNENPKIVLNQVIEDAHKSFLQWMFMSIMSVTTLEKEVAKLKRNDPLNTQVTALVDEHLDSRLGATRDEFMSYLSASITARITEQVKNEDKNEDPSTGSDRGLKKKKTSKDAEPTTCPKTKESKSGSSKVGKSQSKSSEPTDLDWNARKTPQQRPTQSWLMTLVFSADKPSKTFDELMSSSINFSAYIMNDLKITNLTQETLLGPAFKLLKGTHFNFTELEYDFKECYKALSKKLDWDNPEGGDYPFDLTKPLPLVMSGNRQMVPIEYFFNNDLKYLQGRISTMTKKLDRRNEIKARGTLVMAFPNKDQLNFHSYQDAKLLMEAIDKRYGGNKESKKVQRTLLKQQYENFIASSLETLDQTFNRLQKLISQLEIQGEDMNLKLLRSLPSEWETHALIWRNKAELETISLDDLYKNVKIYEPKLSGSSNINKNLQNMAFVSSNSTSSTNEADTTASRVTTAHTQGTTVNSTSVDNLSDVVICAFLASQPNSPQLAKEDLEQIDTDDLEEMDLHWEMAMLTIRARRALKNQDNRGREYGRKTVPVETPTENALIAQDEIRGYDWSYQAEEEIPTNYAFTTLTSSESSSSFDSEADSCSKSCLQSVKERLVHYKKNEVVFTDKINVLNLEVKLRDNVLAEYTKNLEKVKKERDECKLTLKKLQNSTNSLNNLLDSQVSGKSKAGLEYKEITPDNFVNSSEILEKHENRSDKGYHAVFLPFIGNYMPPKHDLRLIDEHIKSVSMDVISNIAPSDVKTVKTIDVNHKSVLSTEEPKHVMKNNFSPLIIEDWHSDDESEVEISPTVEVKIIKPSVEKIKYINTVREIVKNEESPKQHKHHHRGNQRNWNNLMSQRLGSNFKMINKACYVCGSFEHLHYVCDKKVVKPVWNNTRRVNHKNFANKFTHPHPKRRFVPQAILTSRRSIKKKESLTMVVPDGKGRTSGKGKIKTEKLDFDDVYFCKEVKYNLFSVSQMCDEKNNVIFTDTECIVLSSNFKLLDESQVLLRVPRKENIYSVDLKSVVPTGGLICLFAKATLNESNLWHMRALVTKPRNKTPYELIHGRPPLIDFMKPFGCPITILNTRDTLGKFEGKAGEGYFVGYLVVSKAIRVFNKRTRIVEETLNIRFQENATNVKRNGPDWLFDIDSLTISMNYVPVVAGNQTNGIAGSKEILVVGQDDKKKELEQQYILIPISTTDPLISQGTKDSVVDAGKKAPEVDKSKASDNGRKNDQVPRSKVESLLQQERQSENINSTNSFNTVSLPVNTVGSSFVNDASQTPINAYGPSSIARIEAIRLFLAYASFKDFVGYEMDVESAFLYERIEEEKSDGIFISQDKYMAEVLKKFDFINVKTASTLMKSSKPFIKDEGAEDVDVHLYRSMISSLMYLTTSRPDITFAACACAKFQVSLKTSHLHVVKRIFRYLKGQPKLGLWCLKDSPFDLEAYSDSDYAGASLDRKPTTGGCQFLGKRLISWQCKKQTIVANSTTKAKYVAAANYCGHVLWIQNQMLDYGFNFINTKIYIDNESTICIVKNPVFHSKTKHIEIRHHFIGDSYEKKLMIANDRICFVDTSKVTTGNPLLSTARLILIIMGKVNPIIYVSCVKQFWSMAKVKKVNDEEQIQALVDKKKVIITEDMIRSDLRFDDAEGTACLLNEAIFEGLACMGAKTTTWNEFNITMASTIICLADNQKFNFSKHKEMYIISSYAKKIFTNMMRIGASFSGVITPLFDTMMVQAPTDMGDTPVETHQTPIVDQPSTFKLQKKQKPRRKQRKEAEVSHDESEDEDHVPTPSSDPLPSGEDSFKHNELMVFYTNLQEQVLDLQETKAAQAKEIAALKKKVAKLNKWRKSRSRELRRLKKIGLSRRVKSPMEKDSLDDETQGRTNDDEMFRVDDLAREEVVMDTTAGEHEEHIIKDVSTAEPVTTAGKVVTTITVKDSAAPTIAVTEDEITMDQALVALKSTKPKVMVQEQEMSTTILATATTITTVVPTSRAKGKAKMIEPEVPIKKKDQMRIDEEYARKLEAEEQEATRLSRAQQDEEANNSWDNIQAMMDADRLLAKRLQAREREELSKVQKARLYKQSHLKEKSFDEIKKLFDREMRKVVENVEPVIDDSKEIKKCMEIVPDDGDEVLIEATPLSSRSPTIIDYKIHKEGKKTYFKIIRADVKDIFKKEKPVDDMDNLLFRTLKTMFEHHVEDTIWKYQQGLAKVKNWKLFESCGVYCITMQSTIYYLLVEKVYPLTRNTLHQL
nr:putative ribonuclease H-like domain-containing protein [Tanacetum cinerariifolium]